MLEKMQAIQYVLPYLEEQEKATNHIVVWQS